MNAPHPLHVLHPVERQQGRELPHESARLHVTGEAVYIDDIPEPPGLLHLHVGQSARAHARIVRMDLGKVRLQDYIHIPTILLAVVVGVAMLGIVKLLPTTPGAKATGE